MKHQPVKTAVLEVRTDVRILAGLAQFFSDAHEPVRSKSELVHCALDLFSLLLEREGKLVRPESTADALAILDEAGLGSVNRSSRGVQNLANQLRLESGLGISVTKAIKEETEEDLLARVRELEL